MAKNPYHAAPICAPTQCVVGLCPACLSARLQAQSRPPMHAYCPPSSHMHLAPASPTNKDNTLPPARGSAPQLLSLIFSTAEDRARAAGRRFVRPAVILLNSFHAIRSGNKQWWVEQQTLVLTTTVGVANSSEWRREGQRQHERGTSASGLCMCVKAAQCGVGTARTGRALPAWHALHGHLGRGDCGAGPWPPDTGRNGRGGAPLPGQPRAPGPPFMPSRC